MRGKGRAGENEEEEVRKKERMGRGMKQEIGRREKIMSLTARRNKERGGGREGRRKMK